MRLEIHTLGGAVIYLDGVVVQDFVSSKAKGLLIYLACNPHPHPRDILADHLWPDSPQPLKNLSVVLNNLRQRFAPFLVTARDTIGIQPGSEIWIDAAVLEHDLRGMKDLPAERLEAALRLYQGEFLHGFHFGDSQEMDGWIARCSVYYLNLAAQGFDALIDRLARLGHFDRALTLAYRLLELDPSRAATHAHLMRLYSWRGETDRAQDVFHSYEDTYPLTTELVNLINQIGLNALPFPTETQLPCPSCDVTVIRSPGDVLNRARHFVGREDLLAEVCRWLEQGTRVNLFGFGGIGKTTLAAEIAARYAGPGDGPVLWVEVGREDADTVLVGLGLAFQQQQEVATARGEARAQAVRRLLNDRAVRLLVLDNAWNAPALQQVLRACPADLPVLVTSREQFAIGKLIPVSDLEPYAALELLSHHACREYSAADRAAVELCRRLGGHPYAIEIAGKVLDADQIPPAELLRRAGHALHDMPEPGFPYHNVQNLIETSLAALDDTARDAFLTFGALFAPTATPELLALCLDGPIAGVEQALVTLRRRGLADDLRREGDGLALYRVHDLSHSYARSQAPVPQQAVIDACRRYTLAHQQDMRALDAERANILNAARCAFEHRDFASLLDIMRALAVDGPYVASHGYDGLLLEQMDHAIEAAREDPAHTYLLHRLLGKRGDACRYQAQHDQALACYEASLQLAYELDLVDRQVILLMVIGGLLADAGRHADAGAIADQAQAAADRLGRDDMQIKVIQMRGYLAQAQGDYAAARSGFEQNVALARRIGDPHELFFALSNLGAAEHDLGHFDAALAIFEENHRLAETENKPLWQAMTLYAQGMTHFERGDVGRGCRQLRQARAHFRALGITAKAASVEAYCQKHGIVLEDCREQGEGNP